MSSSPFPGVGPCRSASFSPRHGPWWPGLDEIIGVARRFYPDSLASSGRGEGGVGGLDVLVETTVHP